MRTRCAVLLAWLTAALVGFALAPAALAAAVSPASGSAYPWVQPWTAQGAVASVGPWTQPPASVDISGQCVTNQPTTSYAWVQPWQIRGSTCPDVGPWTQPASIG